MTSPDPSITAPPAGRLLALETSGRQGSVTAMEVPREGGTSEQQALLTRELPPQERAARTLVPTIQELLAEIGWKIADIRCVAIAIGPGSFTGLRVGVTTAKTLAYVSGAALVAINTLDALAEPSWLDRDSNNAPSPEALPEKLLPEGPGPHLWSALDAQRSEVFTARYQGLPNNEETQVQRLTQADLFSQLRPGDRVIAPHAPLLSQRYEDAAAREADVTWIIAQPMADAVARLGAAKWQAGQLADPFQLAPQYHRISAAEENLQ